MVKFMRERILKIFNDWDPVGIKPLTPDDEYIVEVNEIESAILKDMNISKKSLSEIISTIFIKNFGKDVFVSSSKDVEKIASKILASCKEIKDNKR